jgi:hypothetical protein
VLVATVTFGRRGGPGNLKAMVSVAVVPGAVASIGRWPDATCPLIGGASQGLF